MHGVGQVAVASLLNDSGSKRNEDPLMEHAMEVYASDSFSLFRQEYEKSKVLSVEGQGEYMLVHREADKNIQCFCYKVYVSSFDEETVDCCCNHFAVTGMLCSHAIAVLKRLCIEKIPDQYLLKWRMKSMHQSSIEEPLLPNKRKIHPSFDDCINRHVKKTGRSELDNGRLTLSRFSMIEENCDGTNHFGSPILIHAKKMYLPETYELFREEYRKSECLIARVFHKFVDWRGLVYDFEVSKPWRVDLHKVHAEAKDGTIKCSCRKFETSGILCAHALAVFNSICIVKIPHQYLVPKFLKDPNAAVDENIQGPEYKMMLEYAKYRMIREGSTLFSCNKSVEREEESLAAVKDEYGALSENRASKKRKASDTEEEEEMVGKWKLYDDQLLNNFSYKKSEIRKRKVMDYTRHFPTQFF